MNRNIFISKKMYVAPLISFEEVEEEQDLLAGSTTTAETPEIPPGQPGTNPYDPLSTGAKESGGMFEDAGEGDFVYEIDDR